MSTTRTRWPLALLLVALVAPAAACGDGPVGTSEVASIDGTDGEQAQGAADDGDEEEVTPEEREDAMLEFAACMREHGVDMPDPQVNGDGGVIVKAGGPEGGGPPSEAEREDVEAAHEACEPILEDAFADAPELSPEEEAEQRDRMLAFTECMREHGIDMPDPEFGEGPGGMRLRVGGPEGEAPGFDPESPEFQDAQEACDDELGEGGRGPAFRADGSGGGSTGAGG
jgi:hypothetical protein